MSKLYVYCLAKPFLFFMLNTIANFETKEGYLHSKSHQLTQLASTLFGTAGLGLRSNLCAADALHTISHWGPHFEGSSRVAVAVPTAANAAEAVVHHSMS